jgi:antiviral helicase SKI2
MTGPPQEWVRGNASNVPFWPGGMEWNPLLYPSLLESHDLLEELSFCKDLKTVPPGFMEGMNFGAEDINLTLASALKPGKAQIGATEDKNLASESIIDLADLLRGQGSVFDWMEEQSGKEVKEEPSPTLSKELVDVDIEEIPVVDISKATSLSEHRNLKSTEWAEIIDVNSIVQNFQQAVPNPAHVWPFELDNFQKHVRI